MRYISFCLLFLMLSVGGSAMAEHTTIPKGTNDNFSEFLCTYCEDSQTYYIMTCSKWQLGSFVIPFTSRYHVYQIDNNLSHVQPVFTTSYCIHSLLSTSRYLFYEREAPLHTLYTETYYYDYQKKTHTRITSPGTHQLLAASDDELIFFSQQPENGIYVYTMSDQSTSLLLRANKVISCSDGMLLFQRDDSIHCIYSLTSGQTDELNTPQSESITYAGYGIFLDEENGFIWRNGSEPMYKSMLNRYGIDSIITSLGVSNQYICSYSPSSNNHSGTNMICYFPIEDWGQEIAFTIKGTISNINLINDSLFFYDAAKHSIVVYNLHYCEMITLAIR